MPRLLLVDDNEVNRELLSGALEQRGFDVVVAVDGAAAVTSARLHKPDLVLMDMNMPVVDGWEATRQMKADATLAAIPVLALSANAMPGDQTRALSIGCVAYLTKPVDIDALVTAVEKALKARRAK